MSARLLHGILLGTLVVLVSAFLELRSIFASWPYHRDWGLAWSWWGEHAAAGALLGMAAALALPFLDRRGVRRGHPGLALLAPILGGWTGFVSFFTGYFAGLGGLALQALAAGLAALFVHGAMLRFARSRLGWTLTGFVTPWFCTVGLLALTAIAAPLSAASSI